MYRRKNDRDMEEYLNSISDKEAAENIRDITNCFIEEVKPIRIFLFGSFSSGKNTADSDFDFYLVVNDGEDIAAISAQAYKLIRYLRKRPVDIIVGTKSRFDRYSSSVDSLYVEGEVARNGRLLYEIDYNAAKRQPDWCYKFSVKVNS